VAAVAGMKLQLERLSLRYGERAALEELTATLEGRIIGVLGANGSGKTSLLQILAGTAAPTTGRMLIDGVEVRPGRRPGISYLPQETGFFPFWQPPRETLSATFLLKGIRDYDPRPLLAGLGLEGEDRSASEFSGGMKQRLRIAQALAHAPQYLIFDEPTTGLDIRERFRLLGILERLRDRLSVIFSTHHPGDAAAICDELLILHRGRGVATGTPGAIRSKAEGRVFEISVSSQTLPARGESEVIEAERTGGDLRLRLVGTAPPGASPVPPRLEDAYVLLTRGT
jgi:ABC-2 type transport system ATP-binding protein